LQIFALGGIKLEEEKDKNELIQELAKKNQLLEAKINELMSRMHELETRLAVIRTMSIFD